MTLRLRFPRGTLKIKRRRELRSVERHREVPVWKIGPLYLVWWRTGRGERRS